MLKLQSSRPLKLISSLGLALSIALLGACSSSDPTKETLFLQGDMPCIQSNFSNYSERNFDLYQAKHLQQAQDGNVQMVLCVF